MRQIKVQRSRGNALVEYVILLMAVFLLVATLVMQYGHDVQDAWATGDNTASAAEEVVSNLPDGDGGGCSAYYNAATGRWHDSESNLFVSFDDASSMGCS
jgi:hypothetical protein